MFKSTVRFVVLAAVGFQLSACQIAPALVDYDHVDSTMKASAESFGGKNLGSVSGDEGGAIWNNCTEKATESVRVMLSRAKALGANAVGDITWRASKDKNPTCKKGWGYMVIWPFILTPLFMSTAVDGVAYKTDGSSSKKKGLYLIPSDEQQQIALAHKIVQEL